MSIALKLMASLNKAKDKGFTVNVTHNDDCIHVAFIVDSLICETKVVYTLEQVTSFIDDCLWMYETDF